MTSLNSISARLILFVIGQMIGVGILASGSWAGIFSIVMSFPAGYYGLNDLLDLYFYKTSLNQQNNDSVRIENE